MYYKKYCVVFLEEKVDFIGVNSLALDLTDIKESTFIFNNKDDNGITTIDNREINYEYL